MPPNKKLMKNDKNQTACGDASTALSFPPLPAHHVRYARAWHLWTSDNITDNAKRILEDEMDSAQKSFYFDEFQEFKKSLAGYTEHWENILTDRLS